MKRLIFFLLIPLAACSSNVKVAKHSQIEQSFAKGFIIDSYNGFQVITVKNPWQKASGESFSYILTSDASGMPDSLVSGNIINTPVKRVIVFSSTHVGFIGALKKSATIVGVSGKDFISDTIVRTSLENKSCLDIGFTPNIDFESILLLKPDVVFLYGLDPSVTSIVKRLADAGIKSVLVSEFLEDHPLGKAGWLSFFSVFYDCIALGDSIYNSVERHYLSLKDSIANIEERPSVLVGLPWKDTWYMAGGKSFTAQFIEDAGGNYLWKDNENTDFIPLDLESVFQKALKADVWINTGSAESMQAVQSIDQRFQHVSAFQKGNLFNNNLRLNSSGGNDFWESGTVRPDLVLRDMIKIFHPGLLSDTTLFYYQKLK